MDNKVRIFPEFHFSRLLAQVYGVYGLPAIAKRREKWIFGQKNAGLIYSLQFLNYVYSLPRFVVLNENANGGIVSLNCLGGARSRNQD